MSEINEGQGPLPEETPDSPPVEGAGAPAPESNGGEERVTESGEIGPESASEMIPDEAAPEDKQTPGKPAFQMVVDVRHGRSCSRTTVRAGKFKDLSEGKIVVSESEVGPVLGIVVSPPREVPQSQSPGKRILRIASDHDLCQDAENQDFENEARMYCIERIQARELPMHLVSAEASIDRRKLLFFFTAEGRIDFRDLVKDLANQFRTRIEMRQIGSRDETKMIGGLGPCGQEVCCHRWLNQFVPISIKMAKQQDLSLNPAKISGLCGRLMCCLVYEYDPKGRPVRKKTPTAPAREPEKTEPVVTVPPEPEEESFPEQEEVSIAEAATLPTREAEQPKEEGEPKQKSRRGRRRRRKKPQQGEGAAPSSAPAGGGGETAAPKQGAPATPPAGTETEGSQKKKRRGRRRRRKKPGGGQQGSSDGNNGTP